MSLKNKNSCVYSLLQKEYYKKKQVKAKIKNEKNLQTNVTKVNFKREKLFFFLFFFFEFVLQEKYKKKENNFFFSFFSFSSSFMFYNSIQKVQMTLFFIHKLRNV